MNHYASIQFNELPDVIHGFGHAGVPIERYVGAAIRFRTHQVHGNVVHILDDASTEGVLNGDAFITSQRGVACFVRTADCVPILVADPTRSVVGAIHAGWRGTAANIVREAVRMMGERFGCDPKDIHAAIGPAICGDCYVVGPEVIEALGCDHARDGRVDLSAINRDQLIGAGLDRRHVDMLTICTSCDSMPLASYRRDNNDVRQVSFIVMKPTQAAGGHL